MYLNCGPLFHLGTFMTTLATFVAGGTNVFTRRVDAEELCRLIEAERCTGAFLVGPTFDQILEVNRDRRYDLTSLRSFGGRPEWDEMITLDASPWRATRRLRADRGRRHAHVQRARRRRRARQPRAGVAGRAAADRRRRTARELPPGETGEIVARGPTVMNGYWNRPEENARRARGGWHHTNDLGRREADGTITFVGPKTRMIKSAAENIYPAEVEGCIAAHPAVRRVRHHRRSRPSVDPEREGDRGRSPTARRRPPTRSSSTAATRIASYKKPRTVEFVEKLPRQGWAVDYDALDARFGGGGLPRREEPERMR